MSVWKKASKAHQKTHRERHQPAERQHLGLLEKKKDYKLRAQDHHEKQTTLKLLKKRALNKNPDEFYHHMINSKIENGVHVEKGTEDEDTPEQLHLMQTTDLKYIITKRTQETRKIEKLQSQLHLIDFQNKVRNKHIRFENNDEPEEEVKMKDDKMSMLADVDVKVLKESAKRKKRLYEELAKRINRERQLAVIQEKLEIQRHLDSKKSVLPPKKVKKGGKDRAPVYKWTYERKK